VDGGFNASGSPTIQIEVSGPLNTRHTFTAMVDTGFTGFLLLPILSAFPIGLILHSTMPIQLADGSVQTKLTCLGKIDFDGQGNIGVIIIEYQNTEVLVGMEFLRLFKKQLIVEAVNGSVKIIDAAVQNQLPLQAPPAPPAPAQP
jgi:predicted aspartyl protease